MTTPRQIEAPGAAGTEGQDAALFPIEQQATKVKRRPATEVARTTTGDSAQDIVGRWVAWVEASTDTAVPRTIIARIGKQVRLLIDSTYTTDQIKNGLATWTMEFMGNPLLSPTQLDNFTWKYALDNSARANAWREAMRSRVTAFSGRRDAKQERRENSRRSAVRLTEGWNHE